MTNQTKVKERYLLETEEPKNSSNQKKMKRQEAETVLVTGGSGLVGKALAQEVSRMTELRDLNFVFLSSKDADLTDYQQTLRVFRQHEPVHVINLAAKVGGLYANLKENENFYIVNKLINENVLRCSSELKIRKCISCLSTCIFPADVEYPLEESKIHLGDPHDSNRGYSMAKRQVDLMNQHYNQRNRPESLFTAIIPTNIYGCHDNFHLANCHVVPGLIHKAYLSAVEAKSSGSNKALLEVCGSDPAPLILCPDESDEVSIGDIAASISKVMSEKMGVSIRVQYDPSHSDGQYKKTASNRKLLSLKSDLYFTPFEIGIQEVIEWFCSSYPDVRK